MGKTAFQDVDQFWSGLVDRFGNALQRNRPSVEKVGAIVSSNFYQVYPSGQSHDAESEELPRLSLARPTVGSRVLVARSDSGERFVLGRIFESGDDDDVAYQSELDAVQALAAAAILEGEIDDHFVVAENSSSGAVIGSTTNTSTPQTALNVNITLPAGTWSVLAVGSINMICSVANGKANVNTKIDGTLGSNKQSAALSTSVYSRAVNSNVVGGINGGQTITLEVTYFCAQASTITANNPQIWGFARRTA